MEVEDGGKMVYREFIISAVGFTSGDAVEYQLQDISGDLYDRGKWFPEAKLKDA